jgi:hypothetical protein
MNASFKRTLIAVASVFMILYFVNRLWRVDGERIDHGIIEHWLSY